MRISCDQKRGSECEGESKIHKSEDLSQVNKYARHITMSGSAKQILCILQICSEFSLLVQSCFFARVQDGVLVIVVILVGSFHSSLCGLLFSQLGFQCTFFL